MLDPKHNIQPSRDYGYAVDDTTVALTEYERLQLVLADVESLRVSCKGISDCPLGILKDEYLRSNVFYACIDPELKEKYRELIENGTFQEKFEYFLLNKL
ncbi:hypothetical protein AB9N12_16035 [Bacteroides sp. AN502(2024)]|uniref:hypothetical protein n=1 Tax=Bacteroides sp. AN502(2024) TaxID=3160599 RepID=UPI0035129761